MAVWLDSARNDMSLSRYVWSCLRVTWSISFHLKSTLTSLGGQTCCSNFMISVWRVCIPACHALLSSVQMMTQGTVCVCDGAGAALLPSPCQWGRWGLTRCPLSFLRVSVMSGSVLGSSGGGLAVRRAAECALYCRLKRSMGPQSPPPPHWVTTGRRYELRGSLSSYLWMVMWSVYEPSGYFQLQWFHHVCGQFDIMVVGSYL